MTSNVCPECYATQADIVYWRDLPINETLVEYRDSYISPVKKYYPSLIAALAVWDITVTEDGEWL